MQGGNELSIGVTTFKVRPRSTRLDYCNALSFKRIVIVLGVILIHHDDKSSAVLRIGRHEAQSSRASRDFSAPAQLLIIRYISRPTCLRL